MPSSTPSGERLPRRTKIVYALGDHTVNLVLSAAALLYLKYLIDVAGLRPALAGAVVWVARAGDAFSDPASYRSEGSSRGVCQLRTQLRHWLQCAVKRPARAI